MRAGAKPPFQEVSQFAWGLQPDIGGGGARLISHENPQPVAPVTYVIFDGAEGSFVGQVIAKKCGWMHGGTRVAMRVGERCFFENGGGGCAFVAACAQFEASLEFEQAKAIRLCQWLEENTRLLLNYSGASR